MAASITAVRGGDGGSPGSTTTGDYIEIVFSDNTNKGVANTVYTKAELDVALTFSASPATNYSGSWPSQNVLRITLLAPPTASVLLDGTFTITIQAAADIQNTGGSAPCTDIGYLTEGGFQTGMGFVSACVQSHRLKSRYRDCSPHRVRHSVF